MAALGQARLLLLHCVRQNVSAARQLHPVAQALFQALLALAAASLVLTIAACSSNSAQERSASGQAPNQTSNQIRLMREKWSRQRLASYRAAVVHPRPGRQAHRSDRTLVAHEPVDESAHAPIHEPPPPDCKFKGPEPDTVDADQWARLKLDYERHCYEQAEEADRKQLEQLLASRKCRVESN
jgi:hypothetical protein